MRLLHRGHGDAGAGAAGAQPASVGAADPRRDGGQSVPVRHAYADPGARCGGRPRDAAATADERRARRPVLSRRSLLAAGGGLLVSFACSRRGRASRATPPARRLPGSLKDTPLLDAWIRVGAGRGGHRVHRQGGARPGAEDGAAADRRRATRPAAGSDRAGHGRYRRARRTRVSPRAAIRCRTAAPRILHAAAQVRALAGGGGGGASSACPRTADRRGRRDAGAGWAQPRTTARWRRGCRCMCRRSPASALKDPGAYRSMGTSMPRVDIPAKVTGGAGLRAGHAAAGHAARPGGAAAQRRGAAAGSSTPTPIEAHAGRGEGGA